MPGASDNSFSFPILIGDIGGTNARFALLLDAFAEPKQLQPIKTGDFETIEEALQKSILDKTSVRPRSAILAVAGPIKGDEIPLTNAGWVLRPKDMLESLGLEDVLIINDFEAQALAVAAPVAEDLVQIGGGSVRPLTSRVVLGPGTGLGWAALSLHNTPGFRFQAKAATSISARARSATSRSGLSWTRSKGAWPASRSSAVAAS